MMSKRKKFLILTILFSLLFIVLIALGSHWLSLRRLPEKQFGIAAFLFAFAAVLGQIGCLAMYIRQVARDKAMLESQNKQNKNHFISS